MTRGPRDLIAQIYALREEGLNAFGYAGGYHVPLATLTGSVRSDLVLLEPLLGIGELAISDHRSSQRTFDEVLRLAADAHVSGLMTGKAGVLHLHLGDGPRAFTFARATRRGWGALLVEPGLRLGFRDDREDLDFLVGDVIPYLTHPKSVLRLAGPLQAFDPGSC